MNTIFAFVFLPGIELPNFLHYNVHLKAVLFYFFQKQQCALESATLYEWINYGAANKNGCFWK